VRTRLPALALALAVLVGCGPARRPTVPSPGGFDEVGIASWYGPGFRGKPTASGERFDPGDLTAAHRSLPFGTRVEVVRLDSGARVVVRINDRGPFVEGRILDLAKAAARRLDMVEDGIAEVGLRVLP
jgi:rare lipoprotein A